MLRRRVLIGCATAAAFLAVRPGMPARGDTLKLKDGKTVIGTVLDAGDNYWVKAADGHSQTVPKDSVQEWVKGDADKSPAAAAVAAASSRGQAAALPATGGFAAVKAKADRVDTPIQAVALWQTFIDNHPPAADAKAAKVELAHWNELVNGSAERINGKWVWGEDREKILAQVHDLIKSASEDLDAHQTLKGIHEMEEAVKIYPNDFEANFYLGYFDLDQGAMSHSNTKIEAGVKAFEVAAKLRPGSAPVLSDLAIAYHFQRRYALSVDTAYRAAKIEDTKEIVQVLINTIAHAPPGMRQTSHVKPIMEAAMSLAAKYNLSGDGTDWEWVRPDTDDDAQGGTAKRHKKHGGEHDDSEEKGPPGIMGNGTGELVSADGYILTNRHVAKEGDYLMVRLADGTLKVADRVVIDDDQDMAIIKIKTDAPLPFVRLAGYDHPPIGEDCDVFGFPLLGLVTSINSSVKMTRGIVTAWDEKQKDCDVTVDAAINPGNSGGPIVDHYGNLLAIATAKTFAGNVGDNAPISSYGLGQGTGRIRKFLAKQAGKLTALKLEPGASDKVLTNEELAQKMTPVTVVVFICRGAPPSVGGDPAPATTK